MAGLLLPTLHRRRSVARDLGDRLEEAAIAIRSGGADLALAAKLSADLADRNASNRLAAHEPNELPLGPRNALRHCTWAGLVMLHALRFPSLSPIHVGVPPRTRARGVVTAHEAAYAYRRGSAAALDSALDMANNEVGMDLAEQLDASDSLNEDELCRVAYAALNGGLLRIVDRYITPTPSDSWRTVAADRTRLWEEQSRTKGSHEATGLVIPGEPMT